MAQSRVGGAATQETCGTLISYRICLVRDLMPSLRTNIAANVAGRLYSAAAGVVLVPVYLHFLGVGRYGLFALLNSYMAIAALLDMGLSVATTREVARLCAVAPKRLRDMIWTISLPYCALTLFTAVLIYCASPWLAAHAINDHGDMPASSIASAVGLAGFALTLQLPLYLYTGGLAGLQRQDLANGLTVTITSLRYAAAIFLLWRYSPSVALLMASQAAVAVAGGIASFVVLWRQMPTTGRWPQFQTSFLRDAWRFAAGVGGMSLVNTLVLQSDKVIIGALLPLEQIGHYMVASVIWGNLIVLAQPVTGVAFPRLAQLAAMKDWTTARATFHKLSQFISWMVLPVITTIAVLPEQTLLVWTGNRLVASSAAPLLRVFVVGAAFYVYVCIPNSMILAEGRTRALFIASVVSAAIAVPLLYLGTLHFGAIGTAAAICAYLILGGVASASISTSLLPSSDWWHWLVIDVILPQAVASTVVVTTVTLAPRYSGRFEELGVLSAVWLIGTIITGLALPWIRQQGLACLQLGLHLTRLGARTRR
jgi:O-antigen/teichoic acid export membrane protein